MIGTQEASEILECDDSYVRRLILDGRLKAQKIGKTWVVERGEVEKFKRARDHDRTCAAGVSLSE